MPRFKRRPRMKSRWKSCRGARLLEWMLDETLCRRNIPFERPPLIARTALIAERVLPSRFHDPVSKIQKLPESPQDARLSICDPLCGENLGVAVGKYDRRKSLILSSRVIARIYGFDVIARQN